MARYGYTLPNGAQVIVTAANDEEGAAKLKAEVERMTSRLENRTVGDRVADSAAKLNQGVLSRWGDEYSAGVTALGRAMTGSEYSFGDNYRARLDGARNEQRLFEAENPVVAPALEIGGALAPALATGGTTAAPSATRMAVSGAGWGGLAGAGGTEFSDPDNIGQSVKQLALDTAEGAGAGALLGYGTGRLAYGKGQGRIDAPREAANLKNTAGRTYDNLLDDNEALPDFATKAAAIIADAAKKGIGKYGDPAIWQRLQGLKSVVDTAAKEGRDVTYREADDIIQGFNNAAKSPNETMKALAQQTVRQLYDALPPHVREARSGADSAYRRGSRSEALTEGMADAGRAAASSGIGGNTINTQRQAVKALLKENNRTGRLAPDEVRMMNEFVEGGSLENYMRQIAIMSPTRSSITPMLLGAVAGGQVLPQGMSAGGVALAGLGAGAGFAAKGAAEKMAREKINDIQRMILRGELPEETGRNLIKGIVHLSGYGGGEFAERDVDYRGLANQGGK